MINKQRFASWLGLIIVIAHISMAFYLFLGLQPNADSLVAAGDIVLPITTSYTLTVVAWFVRTGGIITGTDVIGGFLVAISVLVVGSFLVSLPVGAYLYLDNVLNASALNKYYAFVESAFGGMFVLIFNFMFQEANNHEE